MNNFCKSVEVRWADIDANQHMRHSVYADLCTHARIEWLAENGFTFADFAAHAIGPVLFKEQTEYFREVTLGERLDIDVTLAAISADGRRWCIRQHLYKSDQVLAARHEVHGAWLDLKHRRLASPPPELLAVFDALPRTEDFQRSDSPNSASE
ncbi:acyl-CoA thioesterase [Chitinimonas lacunae]|uniref:Acyl-CoA thioesterase n=1 Tax=Chitinimonas lacunae TaxID=1963018 RepID=A0ABV8MM55_9NEIS